MSPPISKLSLYLKLDNYDDFSNFSVQGFKGVHKKKIWDRPILIFRDAFSVDFWQKKDHFSNMKWPKNAILHEKQCFLKKNVENTS